MVIKLRNSKKVCNFAVGKNARMAESVDATVSNTVGATHPGSSPGPGTESTLAKSLWRAEVLFLLDIYQ